MRVATYSRVSTLHHDQNPAVQTAELRRYCAAREWEITEEIVDHGFSGATTGNQRPGLKRLLQLVQRREVDGVVVVQLDRLFRSLKHLVTTLEDFQAIGVQFVATKDNVDYTTPSGRLFVQVLGSLAEFEKSLLRERTMMGLEFARQHGKTLGRPKKRDDEAIGRLRAQGLSYTAIQGHLGISKGAVYRALKPTPKTSPQPDAESSIKPGCKNV
ncbi:recombinase family protein [Bdellovibrionota bacterium FG-2]